MGGKYYCEKDAPAADGDAAGTVRRGGPIRPAFLLAIAAIVGLAWGALASLRPAAERGADLFAGEMTRVRLVAVAAAADDFKKDMGRYPSQAEGLSALTEEPADSEDWFGPYMPESVTRDGRIVDAAGRPLGYRAAPGAHMVYAAGADGRLGTDDDVEVLFESHPSAPQRKFPSFAEFFPRRSPGG